MIVICTLWCVPFASILLKIHYSFNKMLKIHYLFSTKYWLLLSIFRPPFHFSFMIKIGYFHIYSSYLSSDAFATTIINTHWREKKKRGVRSQGFQLLGISWREKHWARSTRTHEWHPGPPIVYRTPDGVQGQSPWQGSKASSPCVTKIY